MVNAAKRVFAAVCFDGDNGIFNNYNKNKILDIS